MDLIQQWYGADHVQRDRDRVRRFWNGQGRCLATITLAAHRPRQDTSESDRFPLHRASLEQQAAVPGLNIPSVFSNYSTVSNLRYWGGEVVVAPESGNPHIQSAASSLAETLALRHRPVADPTRDAAKAVRLYHRLCASVSTGRQPRIPMGGLLGGSHRDSRTLRARAGRRGTTGTVGFASPASMNRRQFPCLSS